MSADIEGDGGDAMKSRYTVLSLSLLLLNFIIIIFLKEYNMNALASYILKFLQILKEKFAFFILLTQF